MANRSCICQVLAAIFFLLGAGLLTAGLVIVLGVFPNIVNNQINDQKVLGLNSDGTLNSFADSWVNNKYISTMHYWVFNYTNTIGIQNRAIYPDMTEKGPYAYDEIITMDNVAFSDDGEFMTYRQVQTFVFNPNKSCADCDPYKDKILIPDIGFQVGIDLVDKTLHNILYNQPIAKLACQKIMQNRHVEDPVKACQNLAATIENEIGVLLTMFNVSPFVTVTVDELLFSGYKSPFVDDFVNEFLTIIEFILGTNFFGHVANPPIQLNPLNGTSDTLYTVATGKSDPLQAGYITKFSSIANQSLSSVGDTLPPAWWPYANQTYCKDPKNALKLYGTNANFFKNFVKRTEDLPIYVSNLCRSAVLRYDKDITYDGIKGYRFIFPAFQFDYSLDENCGFCVPLKYGAYEYPAESACLPSGLLDISGCAGAPIVMSKPHFYDASNVVRRFVPRFKPTYENDQTFVDIEPNTGTVLQAHNKLQINVLVNQYKNIRSLSVMRPGAYPLVWVNETFFIDKNTEDQLNSQLFGPVSTVDTLCWVAVGLGSGLIVLSIVMIVVSVCCFREDHKKIS